MISIVAGNVRVEFQSSELKSGGDSARVRVFDGEKLIADLTGLVIYGKGEDDKIPIDKFQLAR